MCNTSLTNPAVHQMQQQDRQLCLQLKPSNPTTMSPSLIISFTTMEKFASSTFSIIVHSLTLYTPLTSLRNYLRTYDRIMTLQSKIWSSILQQPKMTGFFLDPKKIKNLEVFINTNFRKRLH